MHRWVMRICFWARYWWYRLKRFVRQHLWPRPRFGCTKILAYDAFSIDFPRPVDLTPHYRKHGLRPFTLQWLREQTGFHSIKVEVHYVLDGQSFVQVLLNPWHVKLPTYARQSSAVDSNVVYVLAACLSGTSLMTDVTDTVLRYQGPHKDFHRQFLRVADLFPDIPLRDLTERYRFLVAVDSLGRQHRFELATNDLILL